MAYSIASVFIMAMVGFVPAIIFCVFRFSNFLALSSASSVSFPSMNRFFVFLTCIFSGHFDSYMSYLCYTSLSLSFSL